jgi:hypothetical protein
MSRNDAELATAGTGNDRLIGHVGVALAITLGLSLLFAWLFAVAVAEYFPYAEEWKILLPSMPGVTHVIDWFRGFADTMSDPYPAWAVESVNFVRPIMNAVYWLRMVMFGENWGAQLYFNFAFVAFNAGMLWLTLRAYPGVRAGVLLSSVLVFAYLVMPPVISGETRLMPLILPQMPFDPLLAAFYLLAVLAYTRGQFVATSICIALALMTKEQGLPLAVALPATFAWTRRRQWRAAVLPLAILALPLLIWLAARLFLFGSVAEGVYVMMRTPAEIVKDFIPNLLKLPLYAPGLRNALANPVSPQALLVACNGAVLAYLALDTWRRWRSTGPEILSVTVILCWGFLALVGLNPRYGAPVICLTVLMLARTAAPGVPEVARSLALAALLASAAIHAALSAQSLPVHLQFTRGVYEAGRDYAAALGSVDAGKVDVIVVLNDPNTMYTAPSDLARVMKLPVVAVHKATDYPWPWPETQARTPPEQACTVEARVLDPGRVEFTQSCGLQIMGARVPNELPLSLPLEEGIRVSFPDAALIPGAPIPALGSRMVIELARPNVGLLYFDPEQGAFRWLLPGQLDSPHAERADHD